MSRPTALEAALHIVSFTADAGDWDDEMCRDAIAVARALLSAAKEAEALRTINAALVEALGGLILHVEERDHYGECFGESPEMKIARKAYQAAKTTGENK